MSGESECKCNDGFTGDGVEVCESDGCDVNGTMFDVSIYIYLYLDRYLQISTTFSNFRMIYIFLELTCTEAQQQLLPSNDQRLPPTMLAK